MSRYSITIHGITYDVEFRERRGSTLSFFVEGVLYSVDVTTLARGAKQQTTRGSTTDIPQGPLLVRSPIPGIVSEVKVAPGDEVTADSVLLVIEAMKMENPIKAARSGRVRTIHVRKGQEVPSGHMLVELE